MVLKTLKASDQPQDPASLWYWKREALLAHSDLPSTLPGPLVAPRFYDVSEKADGVWIWMEFIKDTVGEPWRLEEYAFAAGRIGRFNAAYATGDPLPDAPWLCRDHAREWTEGLNPQYAWTNPYVQRHFSADLQMHIMQLWAERERFYAALDRAPQIFSHFDCQRRNLIIRNRTDGRQELVAVDWGLCGVNALGGDLMALIGSSVALYEWEPAHLGGAGGRRVRRLSDGSAGRWLARRRRLGASGLQRMVGAALGYGDAGRDSLLVYRRHGVACITTVRPTVG